MADSDKDPVDYKQYPERPYEEARRKRPAKKTAAKKKTPAKKADGGTTSS